LAHRGLTCPTWFERFLAILGCCCFQDSPARWVAIHRRHHQFADDSDDPHSPQVNFFWGHMAWLLYENRDLTRYGIYERFAKDILRDRFYVFLDRWFPLVVLASWVVFFVGGFGAELLMGGGTADALQFGLSVLIWGVFLRTVVVWHITWSVNSLAHMWGYRNYETDEASRNNLFVAMISAGEGWHNNHHADPRSARHGHGRWELDQTYLYIRGLARLGLVREVVTPNPHLRAANAMSRLKTRDYDQSPSA
jgi:stearoyl-CoA desaturase (delta-9 desaturase)